MEISRVASRVYLFGRVVDDIQRNLEVEQGVRELVLA